MTMPPQIKQAKLREEFRDFAHSGLWRDEKENFAFFGIDNVADWWLAKLSQAKLETLEAIIKEVEGLRDPDYMGVGEMPPMTYAHNLAIDKVLTTLQAEKELIENQS